MHPGVMGVENGQNNYACRYTGTVPLQGGVKVRGASLRGGKMRGTVRGINARCWVICEAGMYEAQWTTGAAGVVVGCEPLKR